jgi:hypothetical protein
MLHIVIYVQVVLAPRGRKSVRNGGVNQGIPTDVLEIVRPANDGVPPEEFRGVVDTCQANGVMRTCTSV